MEELMPEATKAGATTIELDQAFKYALISACDDLAKATKPRSIHVEYLCEPQAVLDHVSIWSLGAGGYQYLICDYWMSSSSAHPTGIRFVSNRYSEKLARIFDFVMKNQDQFTRPPDACRHGLVQILPPTEEERAEAATWTKAIPAGKVPYDEEEASLRMADEGCPNESAAFLPYGIEASLGTAA
jgi:hypothetical protein